MINDKFTLSDVQSQGLRADLQTSTMDTLQTLFTQIRHIDSLGQLERWIADHQPVVS